MWRTSLSVMVMLLSAGGAAAAEDRDTMVLNDRKRLEADTAWIYNDLERGREAARQRARPMLVVFRCIP